MSYGKKNTVTYNNEVVKKLTKDQFLKKFAHHAADTDLEADYNKIKGKEEKTPAEKEK